MIELVSLCLEKFHYKDKSFRVEFSELFVHFLFRGQMILAYEKAVDRLNKANAEREERMQRDRDFRIFIAEIARQPLILNTWDERLWVALLDSATVHADKRIAFRLKDGTEIDIPIV